VGRQTPSKIWRDFAKLYISIANISGTDEDIDKRKTALLTRIPPTFEKKKLGELWSTNYRAYAANVYRPKFNLFERLYFGP